jgi:hypothetical protein
LTKTIEAAPAAGAYLSQKIINLQRDMDKKVSDLQNGKVFNTSVTVVQLEAEA